jgi:hypothetical protein
MDCFVAEPVVGPRVRADPLAPRNDEYGGYGGGTFVIGLRCASAATVDVPIAPSSS